MSALFLQSTKRMLGQQQHLPLTAPLQQDRDCSLCSAAALCPQAHLRLQVLGPARSFLPCGTSLAAVVLWWPDKVSPCLLHLHSLSCVAPQAGLPLSAESPMCRSSSTGTTAGCSPSCLRNTLPEMLLSTSSRSICIFSAPK